jgi:hypothetical protein
MIRYWAKYRSEKKRQRELAYMEPDMSVAMVTPFALTLPNPALSPLPT